MKTKKAPKKKAKKATQPKPAKKAKKKAAAKTTAMVKAAPASVVIQGEVIPKDMTDKQLEALAGEHDKRLVTAVRRMKESVVEVGSELAFMQNKELKLWRHIKDPNTDGSNRGCFSHWQDYARFRLGGEISKSSLYEYISAASLTKGENPIPAKDVQAMGVKKAAHVAKLPAKDRTPEVVAHAKKKTTKVSEVKSKVNEKLEQAKPVSERKVKTVEFKRRLPEDLIALIEDIERGGMFMEGIRDGDKTRTLRSKLWHAVWINFQANFASELSAGEAYRAAFEKRIGHTVGEESFGDEEEKAVTKKGADKEDTSFPSEAEPEEVFSEEPSSGD